MSPYVTIVNQCLRTMKQLLTEFGMTPASRSRISVPEKKEDDDFDQFLKKKLAYLNMDVSFASRGVNVDFSGGEKKRNEVLQMAILNPRLALLDETDSGLDVDSLRIVATAVNRLRTKDNAFVLITHYQRILNYIVPDFVHVLYGGQIVKSGTKELALEIESKGYDWITEHLN